jgi:hypothetical protein
MGESFTARLRAKADMVLEKTFYDRKSRSFTFERYCEVLQGAFTDIYSTGEEVFEPRKIRILLNGIQDPRLSQAKSQILATPDLKEKFENAVNFLAQFLDEKKSYTKGSPRNISSVSGDKRYNNTGRGNFRGTGRGSNAAGRGGNTGRGGRGGRGNFLNKSEVADKYYSPQEWAKLTPEEQTKVQELRALRDKRRGVQLVDTRNTKQKTDDVSVITNSTASPSTTQAASQGPSISTVTSHRNRNF